MSSFTFSSLLSKFAPNTTASSGSASPSTTPSAIKRPLPDPRNNDGETSKPSTANNTGVNRPSPGSTNGSSYPKPTGTSASSTNSRTDVSVAKKRKVEETRPMTESERQMEERKKLLLQKVAEKKGLIPKSSTTTSSSSTRPNGSVQSKPGVPQGSSAVQKPTVSKPGARPTTTLPVAPKPMSYKEKLEMAAKMAAEKQNTGIIQHKAKAPVQEKKEWQKKLEARQQGKTAGAPAPVDRKSKSPGTLSSGEKDTLANRKRPLSKEISSKSAPPKKSGKETVDRGRPVAKGKSTGKAPPAEPLKRKRSPSPIMSWRGKNAAPPTAKKPNRPRLGGRGRYDEEEDEDDDWIVDDDDDEDDPRAKAFAKKYRYADDYDDYDSGSDMEAAAFDVLEEEERSRLRAIKEDQEQEKIERELAAKKAAARKKTGSK